MLNAMQALGPIVHENIVEMWDTVLPKLIHHLEGRLNLYLASWIYHFPNLFIILKID